MHGGWQRAVRALGGVAVLGLLGWRLGTAPFVAGLDAVGPGSVAVALVVVAGTTVCAALRWRAVARCAGVPLGLREAVAAYYRSQFLNSVLPGGVLGDVHRGLAHRSLRSVFWERVTGQAVQVTVSLLVVLVVWPVGTGPSTSSLALAAMAGVVATGLFLGALVRQRVLDAEAIAVVVATSVLATAGHATVFLVAARAAGTDAGTATLLPIALAVLVVAAIPLNVAGWGPREGAAAWAFAAVGLGAAAGATVATAYGVLSLAATLPGAVLLVVRRRAPQPATSPDPSGAPRREAVGTRG